MVLPASINSSKPFTFSPYGRKFNATIKNPNKTKAKPTEESFPALSVLINFFLLSASLQFKSAPPNRRTKMPTEIKLFISFFSFLFNSKYVSEIGRTF